MKKTKINEVFEIKTKYDSFCLPISFFYFSNEDEIIEQRKAFETCDLDDDSFSFYIIEKYPRIEKLYYQIGKPYDPEDSFVVIENYKKFPVEVKEIVKKKIKRFMSKNFPLYENEENKKSKIATYLL
jgi:hypothetical protein